MQSNRCSEIVLDKTTKRTRRCKLHCHFRGICYIHAQSLYKNSATTIQRIWRGFQKRSKLNILFYNLPKELQMNVMRYVREDHCIEKKWIPSVRKIYKNRLCEYHTIKKNLKIQFSAFEMDIGEYSRHMYSIFILELEARSKLDILY